MDKIINPRKMLHSVPNKINVLPELKNYPLDPVRLDWTFPHQIIAYCLVVQNCHKTATDTVAKEKIPKTW